MNKISCCTKDDDLYGVLKLVLRLCEQVGKLLSQTGRVDFENIQKQQMIYLHKWPYFAQNWQRSSKIQLLVLLQVF